MEIVDITILGLLSVFVLILLVLIRKNSTLSEENKQLIEILKQNETRIENYEASHEAVAEAIEKFSSSKEVMNMFNAGESQQVISEKLNMAVAKIELIIKFDKLKKNVEMND